MRDAWLSEKIATTKKLGWAALAGLVLIPIGLALSDALFLLRAMVFFLAAVAIIPIIFYVNILTIWHWKRRYRGEKSELWGALLLIKTSGWFKIVYWFRHILPDWRGSGRYAQQTDTPNVG
jgi:hypothetical protein